MPIWHVPSIPWDAGEHTLGSVREGRLEPVGAVIYLTFQSAQAAESCLRGGMCENQTLFRHPGFRNSADSKKIGLGVTGSGLG